MLEDILVVKHPSEHEFMLHAYPWRNSDQKTQRHRLVIRVLCESPEQRDEWSNEITNRLNEESKRMYKKGRKTSK